MLDEGDPGGALGVNRHSGEVAMQRGICKFPSLAERRGQDCLLPDGVLFSGRRLLRREPDQSESGEEGHQTDGAPGAGKQPGIHEVLKEAMTEIPAQALSLQMTHLHERWSGKN